MYHDMQAFSTRSVLSWQDIWGSWIPNPKPFQANKHWESALRYLKLPVDPIHLGHVKGEMGFPMSSYNLFTAQNLQKVHTLILMIHEVNSRSILAKDIFGEIECAVSDSIWRQYSLEKGNVIVVENVTVLPGPILNLTASNISSVFQ